MEGHDRAKSDRSDEEIRAWRDGQCKIGESQNLNDLLKTYGVVEQKVDLAKVLRDQ